MNVVIFGKGFGKPRQINLSGRGAAAVGVGMAGFLGSLAFAAGYWYSAHNGSGVSIAEVAELTSALDGQRTEQPGTLAGDASGAKKEALNGPLHDLVKLESSP